MEPPRRAQQASDERGSGKQGRDKRERGEQVAGAATSHKGGRGPGVPAGRAAPDRGGLREQQVMTGRDATVPGAPRHGPDKRTREAALRGAGSGPRGTRGAAEDGTSGVGRPGGKPSRNRPGKVRRSEVKPGFTRPADVRSGFEKAGSARAGVATGGVARDIATGATRGSVEAGEAGVRPRRPRREDGDGAPPRTEARAAVRPHGAGRVQATREKGAADVLRRVRGMDRGVADGPADSEPAPGPRGAGRGGVWLYGSHAVAAALANPQRELRRLLLTEEAEAGLRERGASWPLVPERIDRARLDLLLGRDAVHGGVALLADPLASPALGDVLAGPGPVLVLDQVSDPRNVGAILRSAASFGACAVVVQDRNAPDETGVLAKAASGALERVPLLRAVNLARTLGALKAAGLWVVGLDAGAAALSGPALSERRVVLVLGAEGAGLRRLTRESCDELAGLAMPGGMESLNVSAAAAVALYELNRAG